MIRQEADFPKVRALQPADPPKRAPYTLRLDPESRQSIAILTGSRAWGMAEARSWFDGCKLVLPWHEPPEQFIWPVEGRDCILFSFGEPEVQGVLEALSVELIQAGALFVIWCVPGDSSPATIYRPGKAGAHGG